MCYTRVIFINSFLVRYTNKNVVFYLPLKNGLRSHPDMALLAHFSSFCCAGPTEKKALLIKEGPGGAKICRQPEYHPSIPDKNNFSAIKRGKKYKENTSTI
jgi:hypothetical protein